jgi:hypothetical protein
MDKVDMKFMYIPGQEWNFGRVNGMLPFYAYLHRYSERHLHLGKGTNQMCQAMEEIC